MSSTKCPPMPARSTLGDQQAAVPAVASTVRMPAAAAVRRMVPTLPGSWMRSRMTRSCSGPEAGSASRGVSTTASSGDGDGMMSSWSNSRSSSTSQLAWAARVAISGFPFMPAASPDGMLEPGSPCGDTRCHGLADGDRPCSRREAGEDGSPPCPSCWNVRRGRTSCRTGRPPASQDSSRCQPSSTVWPLRRRSRADSSRSRR